MSNVNANGYCSDCTYYHSETVSCHSAAEPQLPAQSVNELLKRNPVTGQIEASTTLKPEETFSLLVSEGWNVWPSLTEMQKKELKDYLFNKFVAAKQIEHKGAAKTARSFFANFLIDMKKDTRKEIKVVSM